MATKNDVDAEETTATTPRTQRTGPLLAVIGGSALAAALLLGGGVLLGFNLGHADHGGLQSFDGNTGIVESRPGPESPFGLQQRERPVPFGPQRGDTDD